MKREWEGEGRRRRGKRGKRVGRRRYYGRRKVEGSRKILWKDKGGEGMFTGILLGQGIAL